MKAWAHDPTWRAIGDQVSVELSVEGSVAGAEELAVAAGEQEEMRMIAHDGARQDCPGPHLGGHPLDEVGAIPIVPERSSPRTITGRRTPSASRQGTASH